MSNKKSRSTTIKGIDPDLHKAIKKEALERDISVNDIFLKIVSSGAKRLNIVAEVK